MSHDDGKDVPLAKKLDEEIMESQFLRTYAEQGEMGKDIAWLELQGYTIAHFGGNTARKILEETGAYFYFPPYYKPAFDPLNDCLRDITIPPKGLVVVLKNLYQLPEDDQKIFLEIWARHCFAQYKDGKRCLLLARAAQNIRITYPIE